MVDIEVEADIVVNDESLLWSKKVFQFFLSVEFEILVKNFFWPIPV